MSKQLLYINASTLGSFVTPEKLYDFYSIFAQISWSERI
jgi:hypothetical protein